MREDLLVGIERDRITNIPYLDGFCMVADRYKANTSKKLHIVAFDVANFKLLNDNYGFASGNRLLNAIIKKCCLDNPACIVATRVYSDHLIGLYETDETDCSVKDKVTRYNSEIIKATQGIYPLVPIHIHSGIYKIADNSEHITSCIDKANMARKETKGNYRIHCMEYDASILKKQERVAEVITTLENGIRNNSILILLQPKINIETHKLVGAEALSRIYDKDGKLIRPDEFIPILEKTGKVVDLDRYVMEYVMSLVEKWHNSHMPDITISINLSRVHFYSDDLVSHIIKLFEKHRIPPHLIEFEVTESVFLSDTEMIINKIKALREYGFKVSIDDFGSGYSSLNIISLLPVDTVKIDKGFIKSSIDTERGKEVMKGIIKMLKDIDLGIICEGIENSNEEQIVFECGCEEVQGFLYDKPIPVLEFKNKYF